jgi:hypothetical protein
LVRPAFNVLSTRQAILRTNSEYTRTSYNKPRYLHQNTGIFGSLPSRWGKLAKLEWL